MSLIFGLLSDGVLLFVPMNTYVLDLNRRGLGPLGSVGEMNLLPYQSRRDVFSPCLS
jgi:hypothetical protein